MGSDKSYPNKARAKRRKNTVTECFPSLMCWCEKLLVKNSSASLLESPTSRNLNHNYTHLRAQRQSDGCSTSRKLLNQRQLFLSLHTWFVLKEKKSKKQRDTRKKSLCLFLNSSPSLLVLRICIYAPDSLLIPVSPGLLVCQSVFLAHAMSSDRGLCPVRCSISRSIRLQKPNWSSG